MKKKTLCMKITDNTPFNTFFDTVYDNFNDIHVNPYEFYSIIKNVTIRVKESVAIIFTIIYEE